MRWSWFPSLLFGNGLVLSVLMLTMIMLRRFGLSNAQIALYISLLSVPFALRPLFEIVVTHFSGTTKVWVLSSEFISSLSLWAIAFTLPSGYWLQATLCFMPFFVVAGVFYDIALKRFYIDEPPRRMQKIIATLARAASLLFGIGVVAMLAGNMEVVTRNVRYSWSLVFYIMAGVEFFLWLWHSIFLPGGKQPYAPAKDLFGMHRNEYNSVADSMTSGFGNRLYLYFFLLFVIPEAFMSVVSALFAIDAPHNGGLGLSPQEFGLTYGTIAIIALFIGHTLGDVTINRCGLRCCLLPMTVVLAAHGLAMFYLSDTLPAALSVISIALFAGNLAAGFGLNAYRATMARFAANAGSALRRAIALGLTSLTFVVLGMFSGLLQTNIGYRQFFTISTCLYSVSVIMAIAGSLVWKRNNS